MEISDRKCQTTIVTLNLHRRVTYFNYFEQYIIIKVREYPQHQGKEGPWTIIPHFREGEILHHSFRPIRPQFDEPGNFRAFN